MSRKTRIFLVVLSLVATLLTGGWGWPQQPAKPAPTATPAAFPAPALVYNVFSVDTSRGKCDVQVFGEGESLDASTMAMVPIAAGRLQ